MTVTGLEHVPNGQSVRAGLTANNVGYKVADYFLTDAAAVPWKMSKNMNSRVYKMRKTSLYEFQSAVFNKLCHYSPNAFFLTSPTASKSS